jgi:lipopolysaccharide export system protein LptA
VNQPTVLLLIALSAASVHAQKPAKPPLSPTDLHREVGAVSGRAPAFKGAPAAAPVGEGTAAPDAAAPAPAPLKKEKGPTEISALEATFDQKNHQAVFIGEVEVKDPEFNVKCDRLTAHLKSAAKPKPGEVPEPKVPDPKPADPKASKTAPPAKPKGGGGLHRAVAEASPGKRVVIVQDKKDADGTVQHSTGEADKASYDAVTGDIVLTGMPEIQQGINRVVATARSTVMTLNRDGHMNAKGPHKTIIVDKGSGGGL